MSEFHVKVVEKRMEEIKNIVSDKEMSIYDKLYFFNNALDYIEAVLELEEN